MSPDAHARPPEFMRALFKKWQKSLPEDIDASDDIIEFPLSQINEELLVRSSAGLSNSEMHQTYNRFLASTSMEAASAPHRELARYEIRDLPGRSANNCQIELLNRILHRDLSNPSHKSNLHLHYDIQYPHMVKSDDSNDSSRSFFLSRQSDLLHPKDPSIHSPITIKQMLSRKLRWITLGGQYDWTAKVYPLEAPPKFPGDIAGLLKGLFPDVDAQAAIVNFYTPGDTLSVHRDVSEECDRDLISISIGCDGLFILGIDDGERSAAVRLKSGDVVLMSQPSRYAWHAVPKVIPETCPEWLQAWPANAQGNDYSAWYGWMSNKRININVRQIQT